MTAPKKPAARRPATAKKPADHQAPAAKVSGKKSDDEREITLHGVTVTLNVAALRSPRTAGDLMLMQEVSDQAEGGDVEDELAEAATIRTFRLLRNLFGLSGTDRIHTALEREHGADYGIQHLGEFLGEALQAANPES